MKALVKTKKGVGFIEVRDVPEPRPGAVSETAGLALWAPAFLAYKLNRNW
jgi:hypothetical protein